MFEDKTTLQAACISFDYMWSYCAIWALIWSATSVVNADYNGVMITIDEERRNRSLCAAFGRALVTLDHHRGKNIVTSRLTGIQLWVSKFLT